MKQPPYLSKLAIDQPVCVDEPIITANKQGLCLIEIIVPVGCNADTLPIRLKEALTPVLNDIDDEVEMFWHKQQGNDNG